MGPGTWGEWFGAVATFAASGVALYFGVRDQAKHDDRKDARRELHTFARERLRQMDRWDAGTATPDYEAMRNAPTMDAECARVVLIVDRLAPRRARESEKVLRGVYGDRSVNMAILYPERVDEHVRLYDAPLNDIGVHESLTQTLLKANYELVVDGEPGPLRRRGAVIDATSERALLRRAFTTLTKV